jgi:hypothetical protein
MLVFCLLVPYLYVLYWAILTREGFWIGIPKIRVFRVLGVLKDLGVYGTFKGVRIWQVHIVPRTVFRNRKGLPSNIIYIDLIILSPIYPIRGGGDYRGIGVFQIWAVF